MSMERIMKQRLVFIFVVVLLLWPQSALLSQESLTLKTVSQKPLAYLADSFYRENDLVNFSYEYSPRWLLFSLDGRRVLPQSGVGLSDPAIIQALTNTKVLKGGTEVRSIDSFLTITVKLADGQESPASVDFNSLTNFRYSPDLEHWALALENKKNRDLYMVVFDGREIYRVESAIARSEEPISDLTLSPDGQHLAFIIRGGGFLKKNQACVVLDGKEGSPFFDIAKGSLTFSPDSQHLAYFGVRVGMSQKAVLFCDNKEIDSKAYNAGIFSAGTEVKFSPDGRFLVYSCKKPSAFGVEDYPKIYDTQQQKFLSEGTDIGSYGFSPDGKKYWVIRTTPNRMKKITLGETEERTYFDIEQVRFSPDGERVAYAAKAKGKWFLVVDGQEKKPYLEIDNVQFSPDGKRVAYAAKNDQKKWVLVVDEAESAPYEKLQEPLERNHGLYYPQYPIFFSPNNQRIAYAARAGKTYSLFVDGQDIHSSAEMGVPVFSPDDQRVAVWASDGDQDYLVLDGKALAKFDEIDRWQLVFSPDSQHIAYKARKGKQWSLVVDGTSSANAFDRIITAHSKRTSFAFTAPDSLYYIGLKKKMLYLVDEKIEAGVPADK
jgi:Tol biopolymer transport system component